MNDPLSHLETTIAAWAAGREDVGAIVVVGSRARSSHPADVWSDLDLILFSTQPEIYTTGAGWLAAWGEVIAPALSLAGGLPEWLVLMSGGVKVDVVIAAADGSLAVMLARFPFQDVLARGLRVLVDKTAAHGHPLPAFAPRPRRLPSAFEFENACFGFLVAADKTARLLRRGDLWRAKMLCDADLKARLLTFLEWQAQAGHGQDDDTWYDGRFLAEWADPAALSALPATFAAYSLADVWRALRASTALFRRLAADCAESWHLPFPAPACEQLLAQWEDADSG
ncbi:MAG: aminoglycoside 6-adenylyltransferase [Caldilineales bacterium]|nr:aminoglycoside 6-adenylyltransferase [Caldilineales bacterium]MCW5857970.1 aminoglycoside 6-adenylyltransferase [Caldilineales bacterium]